MSRRYNVPPLKNNFSVCVFCLLIRVNFESVLLHCLNKNTFKDKTFCLLKDLDILPSLK